MGTEYVLYKNESIEICIDEMSNRLSLDIWGGDDYFHQFIATEKMLPEDMMKLFLEGIKNVSYYMDKKEFNKIMSTMENYSV